MTEGVHRWFISEEHEPINGYSTFQHCAAKLQGPPCEGACQEVPERVEAYRFSGPQRSLYVLWSKTTTQTVTIPASVEGVLTDRDWDTTWTVPTQGGEVSFDFGTQPVFLELVQDSVLNCEVYPAFSARFDLFLWSEAVDTSAACTADALGLLAVAIPSQVRYSMA